MVDEMKYDFSNVKAGDEIIKSREWMSPVEKKSDEAEGGCGVIGLASSVKIEGKHIYQSLRQMRNRGNGKGGGIAMVGLDHEQLRVPKDVLDNHYLIQIAYLRDCRPEVEKEFLSCFEIYKSEAVRQKSISLDVKPPEVWRYFCQIKEASLKNFIEEKALWKMERSKAEDEFVYQNTFKLHKKFYASEGERQAFVLCHGKNMLVFKIVGYAEEVIDA
ncbi:MAG: glutamate synthase, partial [Candidatus Aenigmarchaeota archaeon]|nr:glutamate synthase [Candidatus Aenigmarchaeota archaeon]